MKSSLLSGHPRILVVEDEKLVSWSIMESLKRSGCDVTPVQTGDGAIERLRTDHFDLVITDLDLPQSNGFEVASNAKKFHPLLPVIMISASEQKRPARTGDQRLVDYFISKPFDLTEVTALVERCLSDRPK